MSPVAYADPTSWEEWQREYRYGALCVFPPPGVIEQVDALRALAGQPERPLSGAAAELEQFAVGDRRQRPQRRLRVASGAQGVRPGRDLDAVVGLVPVAH